MGTSLDYSCSQECVWCRFVSSIRFVVGITVACVWTRRCWGIAFLRFCSWNGRFNTIIESKKLLSMQQLGGKVVFFQPVLSSCPLSACCRVGCPRWQGIYDWAKKCVRNLVLAWASRIRNNICMIGEWSTCAVSICWGLRPSAQLWWISPRPTGIAWPWRSQGADAFLYRERFWRCPAFGILLVVWSYTNLLRTGIIMVILRKIGSSDDLRPRWIRTHFSRKCSVIEHLIRQFSPHYEQTGLVGLGCHFLGYQNSLQARRFLPLVWCSSM